MKNTMVKVSFIIGVYNAEKYLEKCLDSLINQTYKNIEIILVVNACIDKSEEIAKRFSNQYQDFIKCFVTEEKLGAGGSRNYGLQYAKGDYICFIDCDDYVSNDYIERFIEVILKNNPPDIIICNFTKVDLDGKIKYIRKFQSEQEALLQSVAPWAKIFKREYIEKNNLILRNIPFGEDVIFSAEVFLTNPQIALCKCEGYYWLDNPSSTSHTEIRKFPPNTIEKSSQYFDYMKQHYKDTERWLEYFVYKYYIWYLLQSGRNVKRNIMKKEYKRVVNYLDTSYPSWKNNKHIGIGKPKGERKIVTWALTGIRVLNKLHIDSLFFQIYCKLPMEKLWPSL